MFRPDTELAVNPFSGGSGNASLMNAELPVAWGDRSNHPLSRSARSRMQIQQMR